MDKLIKFFPFLPEPNDTGKLVLAILFYLFAPVIVGAVVGFILGLTIILAPFAFAVGLALNAYGIAGIVFSVMSYTGHKF